jgi:hypothetical protein
MDLQELVLSEPLLMGVITLLVVLAGSYQKSLSYREFRFLHIGKSLLFKRLDGYFRQRGRPLVRVKTKADYVTTVDENPRAVAKELMTNLSPHLVSTAKCRDTESGRQYTHSHFVAVDGEHQTEIYLFANDGKTDVYAHYEGVFTDPEAHLTDEQQHGDPMGVFEENYSA